MTFSSLEDTISSGNPIRFIDAFVENIDLRALDFKVNLGFVSNFLWEPKNTRKPSKNYFIKKKRTINPLDRLSKFFMISA